MNFELSDEQKMLVDQAASLLSEQSPPSRLRALIDENAEWDAALWRNLAELGFMGVAIEEDHGGLGLGDVELGLINEELGRVNAAVPFFSSIVLAAAAIQLAGSDAQKAKYLPGLASGETVGAFAYAEGGGFDAGGTVQTKFEDGVISGRKMPVADAGVARLAVVLCRAGDGVGLAVVDLADANVTRTKLASFDQLRAHYRLDFAAAPAELLNGANAAAVIEQFFDKAAVQAAYEGVGGADACLMMARDYAMGRQIFGRKLAGYQAIKHKLADILTACEIARASTYFGGWAAANNPALLPEAAACARLNAIAAFETAARENIQVHGGIGYTFEANCHFYYRRERTLALSLGNRAYWSDRLLQKLGVNSGKAA